MPLAGGGADKAGNIYERHLTILAFIDVLEGSAHSVRIEVPGKEGAGAEFRQDGPAGPVWAQAKRQRDGGPWTIAQMREVLGSVWSKIEAGDHFRFVSSTGAQELKELVDRAKNAESYDEFQEAFLVGDQLTRFERLQAAWSNATPEQAYEGLRRVEVWLIDEERLSDMVELRLRALVTGSPATAAAVLGALVDGSTHRERRAEDIVDAFKKEKIFLRDLSRDAELQQRLVEHVRAHVAANRALIRQQELPRDEAGKVFELLGEQRRVTLAAGAGFGKSTTMVQVIDMARAEGWPVVVISADRLPEAASVYELGSKLGWPDSPATVLAGAAGTSNALLVIDQLDAVGIVSGRHTDRLSLVRDLIMQAESYPHLRVLVGCRHFDLANDRELMAVAGAPGSTVIPLAELPEPIVQSALNDAGMTLALPPKAMTLLRVPLHLSIAIELGVGNAESVAAARTLTDLFDRYWGVKRAACRDVRLGTDDWSDVVDRLTDWMSARQSLTAPRAVLDDFDAQAQVMASNGVISYEQQRVRFFHETFFDYCFARRFIHRGKSLRDMLTSTEQSLFRRAQVRQLLEYERSADPTQYAADLEWLLTSNDVRLHLKCLVIDLLGVVSDPGPREADMLVPLLLDNTSPLQPRAWSAVRGNPAWFPVLHDAGLWQAAMTEESRQLTDRALWALGPALAEFPAARQLVRALPDNHARIPRWRNVLTYSALLSRRVPLDLMAESIDDGMWDGEAASRDFWSIVHRVAEPDAPTAVETVRRLLARNIQSALTEGSGSPFRNVGAFGGRTRGQAGQALMAAASSAPGDFVEALLPLMQLVMATTAYPRRSEDEGIADAVWGAQLVNGRHAVSDELFASMQTALQVLAIDDPERAVHAFRSLRAVFFESGWFLLAKGYMANPGRFATDAADWLISTPGALDVGYHSSSTFVSRELITAIAPVCVPDELERLVAAVLSFTPYGERSYAALKDRGWGQLTLLNGIPAELRPSVAEQRLAELRRKFEMDDVPPPKDFHFQEVPAPVPAERAVKMSDAQWLRAIAKHHDDEVGRWRDGRRVGNAVTQAPVLEEICRADPQRFGRLLLRFERGTAEPYITAVLNGLTGAIVDPDLLREVCEHARRIAGNSVDRSIVRLIGSHAAADLPHTLIALVGNIAMTSHDPSAADDLAPDLDASEAYGDIDITGMNRDRGAAVFTLYALLREMPARLPLVREALEHAASDPSLAVRAMAIAAYRSLIDFDADTALELFKTAVGGASSNLLTSQYVADFLAMMIRRGQYDRVADVLDDMAASGAAEPSAAAVQLITLASLLDASLDPKVDAVLRGNAGGRMSVVRVCAINLKHNVRTDRAAELVMAAFDDPAAEVREAACQVFYEPVAFAQQLPLLGAFARSAAAAHEVGGVLHLLDESRQALPAVALDIFEQFVQRNGDQLGNMSTSEAAHGRLVVQLVLRVNAQSSSRDVQTRCLDLIDQLVTVSAIGIDDDLASIER